MAVEIGKLSLTLLTHIAVHEHADIVHHRVPGLDGDLAQTLGRPSVQVLLEGIFYGATAKDDIANLRKMYLAREPVDFLADAVGGGYFSQVLISRLRVSQRAGETDQFNFACDVVEYVEPPQPQALDPFGPIDASLLNEATAFVDDVQNAVDQVSKLAAMLTSLPSFGNPTERLSELPKNYISLVSGSGLQTLTGIRNLF
jgi:hypothetical protein